MSLYCFNRFRIPHNVRARLFSAGTVLHLKYTVTEIKLTVPNGNLAGKLWKSESENAGSEILTPPILALHGWLDNAGSFDPLIPLIMKPNMTVLAMDLPGHGFSSHTQPLFYDNLLEGIVLIHRVLRHFQWKEVTLLGHSMGAIICFLFCGSFPELVRNYIALDNVRPVAHDVLKSFQRTTNRLFDIERKLAKGLPPPAYSYNEMLKKVIDGRGSTITEASAKTLLIRGATTVPGETDKYNFTHDLRAMIPAGIGPFSGEQSEYIAKSVKCPVCVVKGEPGNDYEPRENLLAFLNTLKESSERFELHFVPGTHHFHLNEAHLVAPIINNFLRL